MHEEIHPPSGLGTFPYRALVPRLCAGMASVMAEPLPIRCQSANPRPIGQSQANPPIRCQSYVITEAIPALNLGTSALYGEVPSLLGGRFRAKAPARTGASTQGLSTIAAHFLPI